jgi:hypothetical protein
MRLHFDAPPFCPNLTFGKEAFMSIGSCARLYCAYAEKSSPFYDRSARRRYVARAAGKALGDFPKRRRDDKDSP